MTVLQAIGNDTHVTRLLGHSDDFSCLLLEFMPFGNFFFVVEQGPLPARVAKTLFLQLAQTLSVIHSKGVVHGDIKLENLLVSADFQVKFCDFGLAKLIN